MKLLAEKIDKEIYRNYRLFPNNYIAYDLYFKTTKYASQYTNAQKVSFIKLTHQRLKLVNEDIADSMVLLVENVCNPVFNHEKFVLGELTGLEL